MLEDVSVKAPFLEQFHHDSGEVDTDDGEREEVGGMRPFGENQSGGILLILGEIM